MYVEIDDGSGFCFGVVNAITKAEESIAAGHKVASLGDIVHNRMEVQRLESMGMSTIHHDELSGLDDRVLLIRAHGEPPSTYARARDMSLRVIDATCPVVERLQRKVVEAYGTMQKVGGQVVILGKRGHAEVVGLAGQVGGDVIVVEGVTDLDAIDYGRPVYILSQTTQSLALFDEICREVIRRSGNPDNVTVNDTICRQVSGREQRLRDFSRRFDVVIFVAGRKSSNGKVLFEQCLRANPRCYMVEEEGEIEPEWFENCGTVGVCGATSTPKWLMRRVADYIERMG